MKYRVFLQVPMIRYKMVDVEAPTEKDACRMAVDAAADAESAYTIADDTWEADWRWNPNTSPKAGYSAQVVEVLE